MTQQVFIWIIILAPLVKTSVSITKEALSTTEKDKSPGIVVAILVGGLTYLSYYYAGIFTLIK